MNFSYDDHHHDCSLLQSKNASINDSLCSKGSIRNNIRRWSLNISKNKRKDKFVQKTIKLMPSKLHKTLSLNGIAMVHDDDRRIDLISNEVEKYKEDSFRYKKIIRSLPESLANKRIIKKRVEEKRQELSKLQNIKQNSFTKVQNTLKNIQLPEIWFSSIKEIENYFGSKFCVYFNCLRYLFILNLISAIVLFSFVTFPQIIHNLNLETDDYLEGKNNDSNQFEFCDMLTGLGYLNNSLLFYSGYTNHSSSSYSIPHMYFLSMGFLYISFFCIVAITTATIYKKNFIETNHTTQILYSHKIFCSWEFSISHQKAANLKHKSITQDLREVLENDMDFDQENFQSKTNRCWKLAKQISTHLTIFVIILTLGWCFFKMLETYEYSESKWNQLIVPVAVQSSILLLTFLFEFLSKFGKTKKQNQLDLFYIWNFIYAIYASGCLLSFWIMKKEHGENFCYETRIAAQIYSFLVVDFLLNIPLLNFYYFIRFLLNLQYPDKFDLAEFNVTHNLVSIVFIQCLLWFGLLFGPALSIIAVLLVALKFYVGKMTLIKFCKPQSQQWRNTQTIFHVFIFMVIVSVCVTHIYIVSNVQVDNKCGPFRDYNTMLQILLDGNERFWKLKNFLFKPTIVFFILLFMASYTHYLRAKSKSQIKKLKYLKEMLILENKDKQFILSNLAKLSQRHTFSLDEGIEDDMDEKKII